MSLNEIKFQHEISDVTFELAIDDCSNDIEFKKQLLIANVLIIPYNKYLNDAYNNIFPVGTTELYQYLQQKSPSQVKLDIATKDENYIELAQHSDVVNLPTLIVTDAVYSILISLISMYIYDRLKPDKSIIKSEIIITDKKGTNKLIKYDGPAKEYEVTLSKVFK